MSLKKKNSYNYLIIELKTPLCVDNFILEFQKKFDYKDTKGLMFTHLFEYSSYNNTLVLCHSANHTLVLFWLQQNSFVSSYHVTNSFFYNRFTDLTYVINSLDKRLSIVEKCVDCEIEV